MSASFRGISRRTEYTEEDYGKLKRLSNEHISYTTGKKIEQRITSHDALATVFGDMFILGRKVKNSQIL